MKTITATKPCTQLPTWAVLERQLIDIMNRATAPFLARYVRDNGELIGVKVAPARVMGPMIFMKASITDPSFTSWAAVIIS